VRYPREPVTVSADDPAGSHWETGKARGRMMCKPGNLGRLNSLRGASTYYHALMGEENVWLT